MFAVLLKIPTFTNWLACWPMVHMPWARAKFVLVMDGQIAALSIIFSLAGGQEGQPTFCPGVGNMI
jgi:hypothetical protein